MPKFTCYTINQRKFDCPWCNLTHGACCFLWSVERLHFLRYTSILTVFSDKESYTTKTVADATNTPQRPKTIFAWVDIPL